MDKIANFYQTSRYRRPAAIVMTVGAAKEIYDKISKKGNCEFKDLLADLAGCLVGIL